MPEIAEATTHDELKARFDSHFHLLIKPLIEGKVIPFLGAGVNLCGRPGEARWGRGTFLPSGGELTAHLAESFAYPAEEPQELLRVSQYVAVRAGAGPLYEELRALFDADYPITILHSFLAGLPGVMRAKGYPPRYPLIVTTNYDDVLERAFRQAAEPYDIVSYIADGEHRGKFWHYPPEGDAVLVEKPNEYQGLSLDRRAVILKIHGAVDRFNQDRDSYVITEDHYIDFLTQTDISTLIPAPLPAKLKRSHYLFLGYGLRDWNLRVILRRIWRDQTLSYKSWAVEVRRQPLEEEFWKKREVDIINADLNAYMTELGRRVQALPHRPAGGGS